MKNSSHKNSCEDRVSGPQVRNDIAQYSHGKPVDVQLEIFRNNLIYYRNSSTPAGTPSKAAEKLYFLR